MRDSELKTFLNTYNFVPFVKEPVRGGAAEKRSGLTGVIRCALTPRTDLFIPNTSNETCAFSKEAHGKVVREFFSYDDLEEKNDYDLSTHPAPQKPVLPGSELRGMIRSMYEAFTDSCLSALDIERPLSSRSSDVKKAGVLKYEKNGGWKLYSARVYRMDYRGPKDDEEEYDGDYGEFNYYTFEAVGCFESMENQQKVLVCGEKTYTANQGVWFSYCEDDCYTKQGKKITIYYVNGISDKKTNDCNQYGYLCIGEEFGNDETKKDDQKSEKKNKNKVEKHNEFIFLPSKNPIESIEDSSQKKPKKLTSDMISDAVLRFHQSLNDFYRNPKVNRDQKALYIGRDIPVSPQDGSVFTVWYSANGGKLYLSPACLGRDVYYHTLHDFAGEHRPCSQRSNLCEACALFGFVGKEGAALGSRLRIADAVFAGEQPPVYREPVTLKELSSPKLTSMEMYTKVKGKANHTPYWNYDFYKLKIYDSKKKKEVWSYQELQKTDISLNGRKFYYHHPQCSGTKHYALDPKLIDAKKSERVVTVRPLAGEESNRFTFDVYFEHITENELQKLLMVLSLFGNDSSHLYKLGMGKPLGLGSVKICVETVLLRTIDLTREKPYQFAETKDYQAFYQGTMNTEMYEKLFGTAQAVLDQLSDMTDFDYAARLKEAGKITDDDYVHYPTTTNPNDEGFKWFSNNRTMGGNSGYEQKLGTDGILCQNEKNKR
ncbi:MAG: TIGR03986 family CRISPR-associated RAMP protein [Ruminococcus sp.]|nr:TIGR03986 family CRISPR-associated RAMP protein [Oscillospiraceae bacterium]MBQ8687873.1 TIGR03986 family CRISPR-associated RAMP protein [Ruminococcus sp.]